MILNPTRAAEVDVLVGDAPGWADASTVWLAQGSQLTMLPTGASVDDLSPTIRLMHELTAKGIADWRLALALTRIHSLPMPPSQATTSIRPTIGR